MTNPSTPAYTELKALPGGDAQAIIDTALEAAEPKELGDEDAYAFVVPAGATLRVEDLERFLEAPRRKKGTVSIATVESLVDYVKDHLREGTTVWVHPTSGAVAAVLNDHDTSVAGWGDHRVALHLIQTDEWKHWLELDGERVEQERFAEHIEDGVKEIVSPDAATMLEVAQSIHATNTASFRSATRLQSGEVQMRYDEQIEGSAGRSGEMPIPQEFVLAIAPFVGEEPYRLNARLRYRITGGKLRIGYRLERPADVVRDALDKIAERLREEFPNVYLGEPR